MTAIAFIHFDNVYNKLRYMDFSTNIVDVYPCQHTSVRGDRMFLMILIIKVIVNNIIIRDFLMGVLLPN